MAGHTTQQVVCGVTNAGTTPSEAAPQAPHRAPPCWLQDTHHHRPGWRHGLVCPARDGWPAGFSGRAEGIQLRQGEDEVASIIDLPLPLGHKGMGKVAGTATAPLSFRFEIQGDIALVIQELGLVDLHLGCSTILLGHWVVAVAVAHQRGN